MHFTVYTGPDPEACLAELFRRTPLRAGTAVAVTPDARSASGFERMLAASLGGAYAGHRVYTMEGLAGAVSALDGPVPETAEPHIRRALAGEIVKGRLMKGSAWETLAVYPGFIDLLLSWLADIRSGEAEPSDPGLASVAAAYDSHLRRLGLSDHEGFVTLATGGDLPERYAGSIEGSFIIHGFTDLTRRQALLLERISSTARRTAASVPYDPSRAELFSVPGALIERFRALGARIVEVEPPPPAGARGVFLGFRGDPAHIRNASGATSIHTFRSEASEADWIAGTVLSLLAGGECTPEDIIVVSKVRRGFGSPLHTSFARCGIPVEGGFPRPMERHPVVRFALSSIDASIRPSDENFLRAVRASVFTRGGNGGRDPFDGRSWNCMVEVGSPEDFVSSVRNMLDILGVRERLDGAGDSRRAMSERAAYSRFMDLLDSFARLYAPFHRMMHAPEFAGLLRLFLRDIPEPVAPAEGAGALLADVNTARHAVRPVVFLTGLDIESFPGRHGGFSLHDPAAAARMRDHAEREEPLLFLLALRGAERLFLTFPGIDDEGGDASLSPHLREIRESSGWEIGTFFHRAVPGAAWEGGATDRRGVMERIVRQMRGDSGGAQETLSAVERNDPALSGILREVSSRSTAMENDRGYRLTAERSLDALSREWGPPKTFTVSELEDYTDCPVRFLFTRVLRIEVEREVSGELDPALRGMIVHDIVARFHRALLEHDGAADVFSDRGLLHRVMDEACEHILAGRTNALTGLHPVEAGVERRFIRRWMEAFVESEMEYARTGPFRPAFCEVEFGRPGRGDEPERLPLTVRDGGVDVLIEGRIDRIDTAPGDGRPRIRIVDYKTGEYTFSSTDLTTGRALQIPLYLKAAAESILPGAAVHDGVFYLLRDMEMKGYTLHRKPLAGEDWNPFIDTACGKAAAAAEGIRAGEFPAGDCAGNGRCSFFPLCRIKKERADADR